MTSSSPERCQVMNAGETNSLWLASSTPAVAHIAPEIA